MKTETKEKKKSPINPGHPEPTPPFPKQHQDKPGIESRLDPQPRYQAEEYRAAGKLVDKVALITGGRLGDRPCRRRVVRPRRRGRRHGPFPRNAGMRSKPSVMSNRTSKRCLLVEGDLTEPGSATTRRSIIQEFGKLDILVSNAAYQNRKK